MLDSRFGDVHVTPPCRSVQGSGKVTIELPKWQLQRFQRVRSANAVASFNPFDFLPFRQSAFCSKHLSFDESDDDQSGHRAASTPIRRERLHLVLCRNPLSPSPQPTQQVVESSTHTTDQPWSKTSARPHIRPSRSYR
jgi:hypothetical protein